MAKGSKVFNEEAAFDRCIDVLVSLYEKYGGSIEEIEKDTDSEKVA